jgi:hypothetical protein
MRDKAQLTMVVAAFEICGYLREGLKREDACTLANIAPSTFYEWLDKPEFSEATTKAELHTKR